MKPMSTRPRHRQTGLLLILIALPLVVILFTATNASAQVCASLTLTTQAEVDAVSCSLVTGDLLIIGPDITDLSPLSSVTSVGGNLFIRNNPMLTNLNGLGGITLVGAQVNILRNAALRNLDGLAGITSVDSDLFIQDNTVLTEFCGLFPLLDASGLLGTYTVSGNATNPTEAEILAGGPCLVPPPPVPSLSPLGIATLALGLGLVGLAVKRRR
jgi:hypothetical protein